MLLQAPRDVRGTDEQQPASRTWSTRVPPPPPNNLINRRGFVSRAPLTFAPGNICSAAPQSAQSACSYKFLQCCSPAAIDQNAASALTATPTSTLAATERWNKHIMYLPVWPCHLPLTAHSVCGFHCFVHPARLYFISLRPLFMLQPALQFCAPWRASSLHLF